MKFKSTLLFLTLSLFYIKSSAQSFGLDITGALCVRPASEIMMWGFNGSFAQPIGEHSMILEGAQLSFYTLWKDEESLETGTVVSADLFFGYRYLWAMESEIDEYNVKTNEKGMLLESRLYFNPFVPRKIKYYKDDELIKAKGEYAVDLALGFRAGWYAYDYDKMSMYSIWVEYNTMDTFKSIRSVYDPKYTNNKFETSARFAIGITIFIW